MKTIDKLKAEIKKQGFTLLVLAPKIGMSYQGLRMALIKKTLTVEKFELICQVINVEPGSLFNKEVSQQIQDIEKQLKELKEKM